MKLPQPGDKVIKVKNGKKGEITMQLKWIPEFSSQRTTQFWRAQVFVDIECIRCMKPYTPMLNGALMKSVTLGAVVGTGRLEYLSPYARYQYYGRLMVSSITGSPVARQGEKKVLTTTELKYNYSRHPQAGPFWFERMKADHAEKILAGAARIAGGTPK